MCRKSTFSVSTWKHLPLQVGATICGLKRLYHHNYQVLTKFPSSCMKGQNLIIVMIKAFSIHKLWLLSRGGGVSSRHWKGVLTAHNWWSVEYETAASGTPQYKGKNMKVLEVEGCRSSVVRVLVAKASSPGFDSWRQPRFFIFSFTFFPDPFRWESFNRQWSYI